MTLVTIDGHIGAGGPDLGRRVARMLGNEYIDRMILPGLDGAGIEPDRLERRTFSDRLWSFLEKAIHGVALGNAAGDPYYATAELMMHPLTWDSSPGAPMAPAVHQDDDHPHSIQSFLRKGSGVLVQRAGAVALQGHEQVLKIGVFASWEDRIARIMREHGLTRTSEAERVISDRERAQSEYFHGMHSAHPEDESLYDLCLNTTREQISLAAVKVSRAAQSMATASA